MKIPIVALIFQGIPEQIAVVTLAFAIANLPFQWKKIIWIGLVLAFSSYILRLFPITFGIHTIFIIGLLFFALFRFCNGNINNSLISSLLSFLALIIAETICVTILMPVFGVTSETLFAHTTIRILISLPQVLILFVLSFIIWKFKHRTKVL